MRVIASFEAKTNFSKLLADVGKGEKILITKNGQSVSMLVPAEIPPALSVKDALSRLQVLRKKFSKQKITLSDIKMMKDEGKK